MNDIHEETENETIHYTQDQWKLVVGRIARTIIATYNCYIHGRTKWRIEEMIRICSCELNRQDLADYLFENRFDICMDGTLLHEFELYLNNPITQDDIGEDLYNQYKEYIE